MTEFAEKQDRIKDKVIQLCREHPEAKSDYRTLLQYYWYYVDGLKAYIPREVLAMLTQPESVTRAFRKAVENGEIVLDAHEQVKRHTEEHKYREHYGRRKPKVDWGF